MRNMEAGPASVPAVPGTGPGHGASDDDPSGIATYSQAGAQYGLAFLWTALLTLLADGGGPGDLQPHRPGHRHRPSASWPSGISTGPTG